MKKVVRAEKFALSCPVLFFERPAGRTAQGKTKKFALQYRVGRTGHQDIRAVLL